MDVGFKWSLRRTRQVVVSYTYTYCNGAKPEYVTGGKEIPNVDDVVTKAGRHDEFTIRGLEDLGNDDSELMNTR